MERRDFDSAATLMNEAIWLLKQDGSDHNLLPIVPSLQEAGARLETESSRETSTQAPPTISHRKDNHCHRRQDMALDDGVYIFQCPLRIHPDTVIADDTSTEICAILAYNCALAHHLNGVELEDEEARNTVLKQALSLYQKAHAIHLQQESVEDSDVSFTLAILNNVAQLQDLMGNTNASTRCFQRMLRILMVVISRTEECTAETDLFFRNCSRIVLEKPAAPAA